MKVHGPLVTHETTFGAGALQHRDVLETEVAEASDLALLPDGRYLVVSDEERAMYVVDALGDVTTYELDGIKKGASGFEAVTYDPSAHKYLVVSEDKAKLYRYDADFELEEKIELAIDGADNNKGVEGMTYLPASASPTGRAALVLLKEAQPKQIALVHASGHGEPLVIALDQALRKAADDFSGVAYDPQSGHLFIASEASAVLLEVKLTGSTATLVSKHALRDANGEKLERIEGIAADANGIYVLTENDGLIHRFTR